MLGCYQQTSVQFNKFHFLSFTIYFNNCNYFINLTLSTLHKVSFLYVFNFFQSPVFQQNSAISFKASTTAAIVIDIHIYYLWGTLAALLLLLLLTILLVFLLLQLLLLYFGGNWRRKFYKNFIDGVF